MVGGEVRVEFHTDQAVLAAGVDVELAGGDGGVGRGVEDLQFAVALGVDRTAVVGDVELHRVGGVVVECDLLVGAPVGAAAVARFLTGRPLEAADDMVAEGLFVVGGGVMAHGGGPDLAALGVAAPGDGVVGAHRVGAGVVRRLVGGDQDMDVTAGFSSKLYHSSGRSQRSGSPLVEGWTWSATLAVPWSTPGEWVGMWAPPLMVSSHHGKASSTPMSRVL